MLRYFLVGSDVPGDRPCQRRRTVLPSRIYLGLLLPAYLFASGCVSTLPSPNSTNAFDRGCIPPEARFKSISYSEVETISFSTEAIKDDEAKKYYSPIAVDIADVMQMLPLNGSICMT